jgi:hypothetical protein
MLKSGIGLIIALAAMFAVASQPTLAKGKKSTLTQHTVKGEHFKEATITARKKSKSKPAVHDITVTKHPDKASP